MKTDLEKIAAILGSNLSDLLKLELVGLVAKGQGTVVYPLYPIYPIYPSYPVYPNYPTWSGAAGTGGHLPEPSTTYRSTTNVSSES